MRYFGFFMVVYAAFINTAMARQSENNAFWIRDCQENRVYINPNQLQITEKEMYVLNEPEQKIPLSEIFCDIQGIYTRIESLGTNVATVYPIVWCKTCGAWRTVNIKGLCVVCGNIP